MKKEEWLKDLRYDYNTQKILNKASIIIDLRCWDRLQKEFNSVFERINFQQEVAEFIIDAINEKLEREKQLKQTIQC